MFDFPYQKFKLLGQKWLLFINLACMAGCEVWPCTIEISFLIIIETAIRAKKEREAFHRNCFNLDGATMNTVTSKK